MAQADVLADTLTPALADALTAKRKYVAAVCDLVNEQPDLADRFWSAREAYRAALARLTAEELQAFCAGKYSDAFQAADADLS